MKTLTYFGIAAICIAIFISATYSFDQYPNGSVTNVKFTEQAKTLRLTADYPRQYAADINKHILTLFAPGTNIGSGLQSKNKVHFKDGTIASIEISDNHLTILAAKADQNAEGVSRSRETCHNLSDFIVAQTTLPPAN
jgi:hypothetical protein